MVAVSFFLVQAFALNYDFAGMISEMTSSNIMIISINIIKLLILNVILIIYIFHKKAFGPVSYTHLPVPGVS